MAKSNLIFQNKFSANSAKVIKSEYKISDDDNILLSIWSGKALGKHIRERGFIFTKRGLTWFFPTVAINGETEENSERSQRDFDFLPKDSTDFKIAFSKTDGITKELHLKTGISEFIFIFPTSTDSETISELESIIRDYFTGYFDEQKFSEKTKEHSFIMRLLNIPDFFTTFGDNLYAEIISLKSKITDFFKSVKNKKTEEVPKEKGIINFLHHTIDLCADFSLITAIVILIEYGIREYNRNSNKAFSALIKFLNTEYFLYFFAAFLVLKLTVIFTKKNAQKIIALLLVLISCISIPLIEIAKASNLKGNSQIFIAGLIIIILLILLTLQFALGFSRKSIKTKICLFIPGILLGIPCILDEGIRIKFIEIFITIGSWISEIINFWHLCS